jgi:hypothetical protein
VILLFLHGPPGVGKLTVALELEKLTGHRVFHNHLTVDLVGSVFSFGTDPFIQLREEIWLATFRLAAQTKTSLIFTFAPEQTVSPDFVEKTITTIESNGGSVIFVELVCSEEILLRRLDEPTRARFAKLNSAKYQELKADGAFDYPRIRSSLTLDTSSTPPDETAQLIADYLSTIRPRDD